MSDNIWDELGETKKSSKSGKKSANSVDKKKSKNVEENASENDNVIKFFTKKDKKNNEDEGFDVDFSFDDFVEKLREKIANSFLGKYLGLKPKNANNNQSNNFFVFVLGLSLVFIFWVLSGFYIVRQEENAIIMRFGKYVRDAGSGLHYHLPSPIEVVIKEATTRVRVLKIGGDDNGGEKLGEGWALTGDENIVNLELAVQWKIDNLKQFVFSVRDREQTIYDATQSAIRDVISKRKLESILTSGRGEIEEETKTLLQEMLNSYNIGVSILVVQMLKIDPPAQVLDSFRDVQTARVDKESEINKAYKYKNDVLPKVRGEAGKIVENAKGYAISVVNQAKGDANRFDQVYQQYKNAPYVTRKRMYLETMEKLFKDNKMTIVDENVKNVFLTDKNDNKQQNAVADDIVEDENLTKDNIENE